MQFPGADAESNTIVITGNENPVAKAKAELIELYEDEVSAFRLRVLGGGPAHRQH